MYRFGPKAKAAAAFLKVSEDSSGDFIAEKASKTFKNHVMPSSLVDFGGDFP